MAVDEEKKLVVVGDGSEGEPEVPDAGVDVVTSPAKVLRIGSMIRALLEEAKAAPLDENSRTRLAGIYESAINELSAVMSEDLSQELKSFASNFRDGEVPSEAELRVAQAQLVGWLEGLFHGIQATLIAQQMDSRQQLSELRSRGLPQSTTQPGNYL